MTVLNFPDPNVTTTYIANGRSWTWDGESWVSSLISNGVVTVEISDTAPVNPSSGDLWWNSTSGQLKIYYDDGDTSQWVDSNSGVRGDQGFTGSQGDAGFIGSAGFTGSLGFTGSQGDVGFNGSRGDTGFTGSLGFTGSKGADGTSVTILGSLADQSELPPSGNVADAYIINDDLWIWDGTSWVNAGPIRGPIGYTGSIGFTGSRGSTGFVGSQGELGFTGSQGPIGYTGSIGFTGSQGDLGFTGSQGPIGYTGSIGFTGSQGDTGFVGSLGFTGSQGAGFTGSRGDTGFTGSLGFTGSTGPAPWSIKTSNYTALPGDRIVANTSLTSFTVTLPNSPTSGDYVQIADGGDWSVNNLTVARNGNTINGLAQNLTLSVAQSTVELIYNGTTWKVYTSISSGGDGFTGSQGDVGFTGSQGDIGFTGSFGFTGSQGTTGFTGSQGIPGGVGFTGSQGDSGFVAIEDEGTEIAAAAARLNFVGTGVTVTDAGAGEVTITIPGINTVIGNLDGGQPDSNYGGISSIDAGGVV